MYNYLTDENSKVTKTITCSDGRKLKVAGFEVGPPVFGLPQDHCILYHGRIPLPTDHDKDDKLLTIISNERLNGMLASTGGNDIKAEYEEVAIDHYVKALLVALNLKYVIGKNRLSNIEFFRAIVKKKMTHLKGGTISIAVNEEEWIAAKNVIASSAQAIEGNAQAIGSLTSTTKLLAEAVGEQSSSMKSLAETVSTVATGQQKLVARQDQLEKRVDEVYDYLFGTPAKTKADFVKTDRSGNSFADLVNGAGDDFDEEEDGTTAK